MRNKMNVFLIVVKKKIKIKENKQIGDLISFIIYKNKLKSKCQGILNISCKQRNLIKEKENIINMIF